MVRRYDIVMVTDARLPGGTSASVAEEVRAQAAAGYRTALLQVDSPLVRQRLPFAPRLRACLERGDLELLLGDEPVECDLVVVRHPTVAANLDPASVPAVHAAHRLLIANQAPKVPAGADPDDDDGGLRFDPHAVDRHVADWLGGPVQWVPIGPLVRDNLAEVAPDLEQQPDDWFNVIDVAAWRQPREGALHRVPVIGRHSRDNPLKWPATRDEVLQVYPAREDVEVHVLGGDLQVRELLGHRIPPNWLLRPFGSMPPQRFLAGIDVYVYYHHPDWVEAFGRSILEALASGAPTVLPPHFEALFEDAAIYAEPADVLDHVRELHGDRRRYREAAARATSFVEDRFGHGVHTARVAALAEPTGTARTTPASVAAPDAAPEAAPTDADGAVPASRRVLFISSNGAGVGHLMRLMALARWAPDDLEPLFLTFSQAAKVVDDAGHFVEYLASRSISGGPAKHWHPMVQERINELIERYDVRAVVFDGTWPYQGVLDAVAEHPHVKLVWSRRAMWKPGVTNDVLEVETDRFDLILEPGEFAADEDRGATRRRRNEAVRIGPVTFLGLDELLDRDTARAELGLDPDRPTALVNLGAGNINDTSSLLGMVVDRLAREPDLQVCVTRSIIAGRETALPDNVRTISVYPLARYLAAFDLAFAASGYNSYHELVLAGVPTAFVPNLETSTDDQAARSRFAARIGVGVDVPDPTPEAVDRAVRTLVDPDKRRRMHERAVARRLGNGARDGMEAIVELLDRGPGGKIGPASLAAAFEAKQSKRRARKAAADAADPPAAAASAAAGTRATPASAVGAPAGTPPAAAAADSGAADSTTAAAGDGPSPAADAADAGTDATPGTSPPAAGTDTTTGGTPAGGPPQAPRGQTKDRIRDLLVRLRRLVVGLAKSERVQGVLLSPYRRLPESVKGPVRRRLRAWESPRTRAIKPGERPLPVPPGNVLPDEVVSDTKQKLHRVAVVLPGAIDDATATALVDHLAELQAAYRSFAPLVVTSNLDFRALRRFGYLFEYFPPPSRWERIATRDEWHDARNRRLRAILRRFDVVAVLTLPEPDGGGLDALRGTMSAALDGLTLGR